MRENQSECNEQGKGREGSMKVSVISKRLHKNFGNGVDVLYTAIGID